MTINEIPSVELKTFIPLDNDCTCEYINREIKEGSNCFRIDDDGNGGAIFLTRALSDWELEIYCYVNTNGKTVNITAKALDIFEAMAKNKGFKVLSFNTTRTGLIKLATSKKGYSVHEAILKKIL